MVWAKRRNGWREPWKAAVRNSFQDCFLFLKLDDKRNEEECWGRSSQSSSQFSPFLSFIVTPQAPQDLFQGAPAKKSTHRREVGETIVAEMGFIDVNFPAPRLTFQRHHHFPTLAVILLNDSDIYLVSLPTPSHSLLILFSFSLPLSGKGPVDIHCYSMVQISHYPKAEAVFMQLVPTYSRMGFPPSQLWESSTQQ